MTPGVGPFPICADRYRRTIDTGGFPRFNFKMSKDGWILANFNFKSETNELFPKDFVDR